MSDPIFSGGDATEMLARLPARFSGYLEHWGTKTPDAPALFSAGRTYTYGHMWDQVQAAVAVLGEIGLRPGDRLSIVAENGPQAVIVMFAASEIGAWAIPINARSTDREVRSISEFSDSAAVVFCLEGSVETGKRAAAMQANPMETPVGPLSVFHAANTIDPAPVTGNSAQDVATLVFTSGSTGNPKAVMLSHQAIMYMGANMAEIRGVTQSDCFYNCAPISHVIGLGVVLITAFSRGASVELAAVFDPAEMAQAIRTRVTCITGVPTLFSRFLDYLSDSGDDLGEHNLRVVGTAGAPLSLGLKARIEKELNVRVYNSYGLTECTPVARSAIPVEDVEVGVLQPGIQVKMKGMNNDIGEIWAKGPPVMLGYYKDQGATLVATDREGFVNTGDLGTFDDLGRLRIVGRSKDVIIRSGFNVYPIEVEAVLNSADGVAQSAVIGRATDDNEEVVAFVQVQATSQLDANTLKAHCRDNLAPYKQPSTFFFVDEFPMNATGKIDKITLRETLKSRDKTSQGTKSDA